MQRRSFLKKATIGTSAAALGAPALAQNLPTLNWRLVSSFPKSLDTLFGAPEVFANSLRKATDGKFIIKVFAAGEVVPALQVLDAVQNGTVECGHTASYYYLGKNSAFIFDTAAPFGMTARQQSAWMLHGNGMKLMRELYASYNIVNFLEAPFKEIDVRKFPTLVGKSCKCLIPLTMIELMVTCNINCMWKLKTATP